MLPPEDQSEEAAAQEESPENQGRLNALRSHATNSAHWRHVSDSSINPWIFLIGVILITLFDLFTNFERSFTSPAFYIYFFFAAAVISLSLNFNFSDRNKVYGLIFLTILYWFLPLIFDFIMGNGVQLGVVRFFFTPLWILYYIFFVGPPAIKFITGTGYLGVSLFIVLPLILPAVFQSFGDLDVDVSDRTGELTGDVGSAGSSFFNTATNFFPTLLARVTGSYYPAPPPSSNEKQGYFLSTSSRDFPLNPPTYHQSEIDFKVVISEHGGNNGRVTFTDISCMLNKGDDESTIKGSPSTITHANRAETLLTCKFDGVESGKSSATVTGTYAFSTQAGLRTHWIERSNWLRYTSPEDRRAACGTLRDSAELVNKGFSRHRITDDGELNILQEAEGDPPIVASFTAADFPISVGENTLFLFALHKMHDGEVADISDITLKLPGTLKLDECPFLLNGIAISDDVVCNAETVSSNELETTRCSPDNDQLIQRCETTDDVAVIGWQPLKSCDEGEHCVNSECVKISETIEDNTIEGNTYAINPNLVETIKNNLNKDGRYGFSCQLVPESDAEVCSGGDFILETDYTFSIEASGDIRVELSNEEGGTS